MFQRSTVKNFLAALFLVAATSASASNWSVDTNVLDNDLFQTAPASVRHSDTQDLMIGFGRRNERAALGVASLAGLARSPTAQSASAALPSSNLELLGSPLTADPSNLADCFGASQGMYRMSLCRRGVAVSENTLKRMLGPDSRLFVSAATPAVPLPAGLPLLLCGLALLATRARRDAHR